MLFSLLIVIQAFIKDPRDKISVIFGLQFIAVIFALT